ncbi:hypothetical protein NCS56_00674400 [Fusarium sp. Ph1]|nr:hypothetical protein NCS56_00674400 [Fusarium sp. Ph1]
MACGLGPWAGLQDFGLFAQESPLVDMQPPWLVQGWSSASAGLQDFGLFT